MNQPRLTSAQQRRLERQLQATLDARVYRRTLALLEHNHGRSVADIAESLGVSRQAVYNWIQAFAQHCDPKSLHDEARPGRPRLLTEERQALLRSLMETTPDRLGYFAMNWTVPLLQEQIERTTGLHLCGETIRRELRRERYVWKRPRYVLEPDPDREKKASDQAMCAGIGAGNCHSGRG